MARLGTAKGAGTASQFLHGVQSRLRRGLFGDDDRSCLQPVTRLPPKLTASRACISLLCKPILRKSWNAWCRENMGVKFFRSAQRCVNGTADARTALPRGPVVTRGTGHFPVAHSGSKPS